MLLLGFDFTHFVHSTNSTPRTYLDMDYLDRGATNKGKHYATIIYIWKEEDSNTT